MSTISERRATAEAGTYDGAVGNGFGTRVVLTPIAAPSILGPYGFAGATFVVAAHMAGWYGSANSGAYLFPFAAMFGGLAQFLAGMWSYRARDAVATAMHGIAGWVFVASAILAWYTASAMMLAAAAGRIVLPLFKPGADANVPGRRPRRAIELEWGEPGVKQGQ